MFALRARPRERGAVMMVVAIMLGSAVLLGAGAITVDVGQLYGEREELQSGADAAATAVATACVTNLSTCNPTGRARGYADRNAKDGRTAVSAVCGRGWNLPACTTTTGLSGCIGTAPAGDYVEVRTATETTGGGTLLPPSFSRAFVGNQAYQGSQVAACARAVAVPGGPPKEMVAPAVTVEVCYWNTYTNQGASFPTTERVLYLKNGKGTDPCNGTSSNGKNGPGNFGWLSHSGDCKATINLDTGWYTGDPGNNTDAECVDLFDSYIDSQSPMALPLFDSSQGQGSHFQYHLAGFGAFMVTGYKFSGSSRPSRITGQQLCSGSERCLYGYFVEATFPVVHTGGPDYGVTSPGGAKIVG
jgi:Flp pilus assembly protein TadG